MEITLYPDADAARIRINHGKPHHTNTIDDATYVDVDDQGTPMTIEFLYVSNGVKRRQVPILTDLENQAVYSLLQESGIEVTSVE